jgi:hypothetical protein
VTHTEIEKDAERGTEADFGETLVCTIIAYINNYDGLDALYADV